MIHYHGTRLSGDKLVTIRSLQAKHAMVSFADAGDMEEIAELCQSFCVDNGAFSAWKSGKPLDIEGYAEFIDRWIRHPGFDWYCIPDVIDGDHEDNLRMIARWREMCSGKHSILMHGVPVWHLHEPLEVLNEYCQSFYRVAFGSSGQYAEVGTNIWWQRMSEAMAVVCDDQGRPRAKLHGLRMLDPTVFSHLPFASADSTNVARNIGIDSAWKGTYTPASRESRAMILMERIEQHGSAARWCGSNGVQKNMELFG